MLPVFGPSTVRDAAALPLDRAASPALIINDGGTQYGIVTLQLINTRASLLGASKVIDDISLDKYTFIRDAYLQRRRSLVFDGDVPETPDPQNAPATDPGIVQASCQRCVGGLGSPCGRVGGAGRLGTCRDQMIDPIERREPIGGVER
jgi:MlaA lipoprotein